MKIGSWLLFVVVAVCAVPLLAQTTIRQIVADDGTTTEGAWAGSTSYPVSGSYAAAGSSLSDVAYASPVSIRKDYKVNTADDFHVVTVINFDPVALTTTVTVETACGNGTPDSKE